jgi:hypothetical protein
VEKGVGSVWADRIGVGRDLGWQDSNVVFFLCLFSAVGDVWLRVVRSRWALGGLVAACYLCCLVGFWAGQKVFKRRRVFGSWWQGEAGG